MNGINVGNITQIMQNLKQNQGKITGKITINNEEINLDNVTIAMNDMGNERFFTFFIKKKQ